MSAWHTCSWPGGAHLPCLVAPGFVVFLFPCSYPNNGGSFHSSSIARHFHSCFGSRRKRLRQLGYHAVAIAADLFVAALLRFRLCPIASPLALRLLLHCLLLLLRFGCTHIACACADCGTGLVSHCWGRPVHV